MGKGYQKKTKNNERSPYEAWCRRHVENSLLIHQGWLLLGGLISLGFLAFEMSRFAETYGSRFIAMLHNGLLIVGYGLLLAVTVSLFAQHLIKETFFRRGALLTLASQLLLGFCLVLGPIFWLVRYMGTGKDFEVIMIWLFIALVLIVGLKLGISRYRAKLTKQMVAFLQYLTMGIKGLIFAVAFVSCRGWVLFDEQELILLLPLSVLAVGVSFFAVDSVIAAGYLIWKEPTYANDSHQQYLKQKQTKTYQKEKRAKQKMAEKAKRSWPAKIGHGLVKGVVGLHVLVLVGWTLLLYGSNVNRALAIHPDLSIGSVMTVRASHSLSALRFLNPLQEVIDLPKVSLKQGKPLPAYTTDFFVLDQLGWLDNEQREIIMATNRQFNLTESKPQIVIALIEESGTSVDQYAAALFDDWTIGQKDLNNGILLLFARNQGHHNVRIEVGYGLEELITDRFAGQLLNDQREGLKSQDPQKVSRALVTVFQELVAALEWTPDRDLSLSDPFMRNQIVVAVPSILSVFLLVLGKIALVDTVVILLIVAIIAIFSRDSSGHSGNSGGSSHSSSGGSWSSGGGFSGGGGRSGGGGASI